MSMKIAFLSILLLVVFACADELDYMKNNISSLENTVEDSSKVLSRRKRYLTFPDGSSFQLVICTQNHGYIQVGDIVWFGNTAALAWELPSDPKFFYKFKEFKNLDGIKRRQDTTKHIFYLDEDGKVIGKVPYRKRPIVNPVFAKRSVDSRNIMKQIPISEMHSMHASKNVLENLDYDTIDFHRKGRKDLYVKLESFFDALGLNGKECVLRLLCETGKGKEEQGFFSEEIMRATFTLPRGREFESEQHKHYDEAHGTHGECSKMYPKCEDIHGFQLFEP